jgi:hypothetical protein
VVVVVVVVVVVDTGAVNPGCSSLPAVEEVNAGAEEESCSCKLPRKDHAASAVAPDIAIVINSASAATSSTTVADATVTATNPAAHAS